jgi:hypothetical protein
LGERSGCNFMPRKSLKELLDVLKDRNPLINELNHGFINKSIVNKNCKHEE